VESDSGETGDYEDDEGAPDDEDGDCEEEDEGAEEDEDEDDEIADEEVAKEKEAVPLAEVKIVERNDSEKTEGQEEVLGEHEEGPNQVPEKPEPSKAYSSETKFDAVQLANGLSSQAEPSRDGDDEGRNGAVQVGESEKLGLDDSCRGGNNEDQQDKGPLQEEPENDNDAWDRVEVSKIP
jgi:hypothetical protein